MLQIINLRQHGPVYVSPICLNDNPIRVLSLQFGDIGLNFHGTLDDLDTLSELIGSAIRDAKAMPVETGIVALDAREPGWTPPTREPNDTPTPVVRPLEGLHDPNVCQCDLCKAIMLAPF